MAQDLFSVQEKIAIVTGGLGQLGRRFSLALADRGAKVAIFDIQVDEQRVTERFAGRRNDENLMFVQVDITQRRSIEAGLSQVNAKWGVPHALINNAALDAPPNAPAEENGPFEHYPESSWDKVMEVGVKGAFLCCQVVGGQMAGSGRGSIINIGSIYGMVAPDQRIYEYRRAGGTPFVKPAAYSASKSALLNLTRYLATYWAGNNVRANTLTLGGVFNNQNEQFLANYAARVPLGRMAHEDEYNGAITFLVSDASSYMTGANVIIDGGWTAW
ncbi:MAG: SDR family oxidoreductase [bacterium]|uniref:SDR family oxidoreductase n=1 Tax=Candidatus Methylomirabilis tolerans TaxID=3123416 RepID=A0AAJ1ETH2_9BACT|nr:SDR family oxidoreductase [Candidatus Methylomirabilis sp.]